MADLNTLTILSEPVSDNAILSGGDWLSALPLENMQVPANYHRPARSASAAPADTWFDITVMGGVNVGAIVVLGNFTTAATMTLTHYADSDRTTALQTFTALPLAARAPWGTLPFGAAWWYAGLRPWPNPERRAHFQIVLPQSIGGAYWRIEINDEGNPDGFVDVCRLMMAGDGIWIPEFNYTADDNQFGIRDNSLKSSTLNGGSRIWRRVNPRFFGFSVKYQKDASVFGPSWKLMDWAGFDREVFVIPDPSDSDHLQQRSFFARISQASPIVQASCQRGHVAFELSEII